MYEGYNRYIYDGPVYEFNNLIAEHWRGETVAPTAQKAKSNLTYQFKRQTNRVVGSKIKLTGEVKMVN